jgi:hypothetical protein
VRNQCVTNALSNGVYCEITLSVCIEYVMSSLSMLSF